MDKDKKEKEAQKLGQKMAAPFSGVVKKVKNSVRKNGKKY